MHINSVALKMFLGSSRLYKCFCLLITIVYFASITYNILYADPVPEDLDDEEQEVIATNRPRKHRKDLSMTEYVQLKLTDLSRKPWKKVLKSPLFRNYLILFILLLLMSVSFFIHALYLQRNSKVVQNW